MQPEDPNPLALIAALPRELAPLARDLGATRVRFAAHDRDGILLQTAPTKDGFVPVLLVTAGMGANRAALAVQAALAHSPVSALLSVGFAGACDPLLTAGSCLSAGLVIDSRTGERFRTDPDLCEQSSAVLVTTPAIAGPAEKARLHQTYGAAAVDMEAATVARLAQAHGIPFGAIKAISDEHGIDLTSLTPFASDRGQFRTGAFAMHTLLRPNTWQAAITLGRNSNAALAALTSALHQLIILRTSGLA